MNTHKVYTTWSPNFFDKISKKLNKTNKIVTDTIHQPVINNDQYHPVIDHYLSSPTKLDPIDLIVYKIQYLNQLLKNENTSHNVLSEHISDLSSLISVHTGILVDDKVRDYVLSSYQTLNKELNRWVEDNSVNINQ